MHFSRSEFFMKEEQIRPKKVFDEYLRLAELDANNFFAKSVRQSIFCPACHSKGVYSFDKHGFSYEECPNCQTIFVNPRPPSEDFLDTIRNLNPQIILLLLFIRKRQKLEEKCYGDLKLKWLITS